MRLQILVQHGHDTNREIARDAAANLEHAERTFFRRARIKIRQPGHVFDAGADGVDVLQARRE